MKNDEFFEAIERVTRGADIKTAVILGASSGAGSTEAFLKGILENAKRPSVFCINGSTPKFAELERKVRNRCGVDCYRIASSCAEQFGENVRKTLKGIREQNERKAFDAVLVDGSELNSEWIQNCELDGELSGARFVFLDDINRFYNYRNYNQLLSDPNYALVEHSAGVRNGYAIFERQSVKSDGLEDIGDLAKQI